MNKTLLAIISAFVISNLLTTLWYMLSDDANFVTFRRAEVNYLGLIFNHLLYAIGFVALFPSYFEKTPTRVRASIYGALLGMIMFLPSGIVVRSIWTVDFNRIFLLNSIAHIAIGAIMGVAISYFYNTKEVKHETN